LFKVSVSILVLVSCIYAFGKTEIDIFPFSEVPAEKPVRLGLIAGPAVDGPSDFDQIENLEILESRTAGDRHFLGRIELARILRDKVNGFENFSFKIPNQVVIVSKQNLVPKQDVAETILRAKHEECQDCRVRIQDLRVPENTNSVKLQSWNLDFSQVSLRGPTLIPLKMSYADGTANILFVNVRISEERQSLVLRKNLRMGDSLNVDDFEVKWKDMTFQKGSPVKSSELVGLQLARYMNAGDVLMVGDFKKIPAANRGQNIKVIMTTQDLEISVPAIAEEQGAIGDQIRVKIPDTQKILTGKLVDQGVVRVE
jgi:flagella basal body P-ring formation protein FlgA